MSSNEPAGPVRRTSERLSRRSESAPYAPALKRAGSSNISEMGNLNLSSNREEEEPMPQEPTQPYGADWHEQVLPFLSSMMAIVGGAPFECEEPSDVFLRLHTAFKRSKTNKEVPKQAHEDDKEYKMRKKKQAEANVLILPREPTYEHKLEYFKWRLDAQDQQPEAIIPARMSTEAKEVLQERYETQSRSELMVLPRGAAEDGASWRARLECALECDRALVLPRGAAESKESFTKRLAAQPKTSTLILPQASHESDREFGWRLQACAEARVPVPPKGAHETNDSLFERLAALQPALGKVFAKIKEAERSEQQATAAAERAVRSRAKVHEAADHAKEAKEAKAAAKAKRGKPATAEEEEDEEAERAERQRLAAAQQAALKALAPKQPEPEPMDTEPPAPVRTEAELTYKELKDFMNDAVLDGVVTEQEVRNCSGKPALLMLAQKHQVSLAPLLANVFKPRAPGERGNRRRSCQGPRVFGANLGGGFGIKEHAK